VLARPSGRIDLNGMVRRRLRCEHQWKKGRERGKVARAVAHHVGPVKEELNGGSGFVPSGGGGASGGRRLD
jgi:hypothetical protein